jgi:hypothetical protein
VDFFGIVGNGESLGLDDVIVVGKQLSPRIMELPGNLDKAGPIVQILHWRIVIPGQACGLSIKNDVHNLDRIGGLK